jgi:hypothetical protein
VDPEKRHPQEGVSVKQWLAQAITSMSLGLIPQALGISGSTTQKQILGPIKEFLYSDLKVALH